MKRKLAIACCVALYLGLLIIPVSEATITDDIDPLGSFVRVTLYNPGSDDSSGTVTIVADLGGANPYVKTVPFSVGAGEHSQVTALFPAPVQEVISVGITEGPDPIPQ